MKVIPRSIRVCGVAGAIVAYPFMFASILHSPWFNFYSNALSDLGSGLNFPYNIYFNLGLIIAGVLSSIFSITLLVTKELNLKVSWKLPLMLATTSLIAIGVFPEDLGTLHFLASVTFFVSLVLALLLYGIIGVLSDGRPLSRESLLLAAFATGVWSADWSWKGIAIQELFSSIAASYWLIRIITSKET